MSTILDKSEPDYRSVKVKNQSQNDGNTAAGAHDSDEFHLKCFTFVEALWPFCSQHFKDLLAPKGKTPCIITQETM